MGHSRVAFERYAVTAGMEPPPRGALAGYATEVLAKIPALRVGSDGDAERLHALRQMENAARGLLDWIEQEAATPRPVWRARAAFKRYAEAAGLEPPPRDALAEYATDVLSKIPALRVGSDGGENLRHAQREMETAARRLLNWIEKTSPWSARAAKVPPAPPRVPAADRLAIRAAHRRAAMRAHPTPTVQDGWAD
jgi:hypothetical protein